LVVGEQLPSDRGLVLEQIDARPGLDRLADCIPMLEQAFASWQDNGGAANFELTAVASSKCAVNGTFAAALSNLAAVKRHANPSIVSSMYATQRFP
jgi:hypothetical protein